jgi:hypothetical protein
MKVDHVDLSRHVDALPKNYQRLSKTQLRLLASQVPESFVKRFQSEEVALKEMLDVIYGVPDDED